MAVEEHMITEAQVCSILKIVSWIVSQKCRPRVEARTRAFLALMHGIIAKYFCCAQDWIEEITGMRFLGETFFDSLKDGVILCECVRRPPHGLHFADLQ